MATLERLSALDRVRNEELYGKYTQYEVEDGWTPEDKYGNFNLLLKITDYTEIPLTGTSVLDVGCGTGDFSPVLASQGIGKYRGVDILPSAIAVAKRKYPAGRFIAADFLSAQFGETYDYVFCSGAFATRIDSDNYGFVEAAIRKMRALATIGVAFNLLTDIGSPQDNGLFFYNGAAIQEICTQITGANGQMAFTVSNVGFNKELTQLNGYLYKVR